jgi:hypothetical protein
VAGVAAGYPPPPAKDPDGQAVGCPSPPLSLVMEAAVSEGITWGIAPLRKPCSHWVGSLGVGLRRTCTVRPVELGCCAGCHIPEPEQLPAVLSERTSLPGAAVTRSRATYSRTTQTSAVPRGVLSSCGGSQRS